MTHATSSVWNGIATWSADQKSYVRFLVAKAVTEQSISKEAIQIAKTLFYVEHNLGASESAPEIPAIRDRPINPSPQIYISALTEIQNVNALKKNARIKFGPGLNVIFGGNGVGKSGYARILHNACYSRASAGILPNVHEGTKYAPSAMIELTYSDEIKNTVKLADAPKQSDLQRFSVFDSKVATAHLTKDDRLSFTPEGFDVLPKVRTALDELVKIIKNEAQEAAKPSSFANLFIDKGTDIYTQVENLNALTDIDELKRIAQFGEDEQSTLRMVVDQIEQIKSRGLESLLADMKEALSSLQKISDELTAFSNYFTTEALADTRALISIYRKSEDRYASKGTIDFSDLMNPGAGSAEWESFLAAARVVAGKHDHPYPSEADACLLCNRSLDVASSSLIRRFWEHLDNDVKKQFEEDASALNFQALQLRNISLPSLSEGAAAREKIQKILPNEYASIIELMNKLHDLRDAVLSAIASKDAHSVPASGVEVLSVLQSAHKFLSGRIAELTSETEQQVISTLEHQRLTLRHRQVLANNIDDIVRYVERQRWARSAETAVAKVNTRFLTGKQKKMFVGIVEGTYATFLKEETANLGFDVPVVLKSRGNEGDALKGLFVGASHRPVEILSEGEQKVVALADFLTECRLNLGSAGVILDDPVTSLDHERKRLIARRIVDEAKKRQVIVFTHDIPFCCLLRDAASSRAVQPVWHWIDRVEGECGIVNENECPIDPKQFLSSQPSRRLIKIALTQGGSSRQVTLKRAADKLRFSVEATVAYDILGGVVKQWDNYVNVKQLKNIKVNDKLAERIHELYQKVSDLVSAHMSGVGGPAALLAPRDLEELCDEFDDVFSR